MRDGPDEAVDAAVRVVAVTSQYPDGLLGIPRTGLRLTWRTTASSPQVAYQVRWRGEHSGVAEPIASDDSIGVPAPGPDLGPGERRRYSVRIATARGWTPWSPELLVEAAVDLDLDAARPIGGAGASGGPVTLLRRAFVLPAEPRRARLHATFWGVGDLRINGRPTSDEHLAPGWTPYRSRLLLATWDVTGLLRRGDNVLGSLIGDGWYRGRLGWNGAREWYGTETAALVQLDVECADGSHVRIGSSPEWTTSTGSLRAADLYDGVTVDLRREPAGWDVPGFDDAGWAPARQIAVDTSVIEPRLAGGVRTVGEWAATLEPRPSATRVDVGQNIAGWLRLTVAGTAGDRVTVRHAEVLEPDGTLHTAALRSARATDEYVLAREGDTTLEPLFTFHGFRYAEVTGARVVRATAVAISSADRPRSTFAAEDPRLERLHSNAAWSQRGNFITLPTDCPQRDERLGWTGDAQAFAPTASTLFDVEAFWMSWFRDVALEQEAHGSVPSVVPNILTEPAATDGQEWTLGRSGWGDVAVIGPWAVYESYGSDEVLVRQLASMRRWVASLEQRCVDGLLPREFQFGDWLDPDAPTDDPARAKVSPDFVANAFFARSARLLADAERLVGDPDRAATADRIADRVTAATWARWGEEAVRTQTGAAIAVEFRIVPDEHRERVGRDLARDVRTVRGRIATGFLGTPLILHALARTGHVDEAYLMLLRTEAPSWLYQVDMGATTFWERWDALAPDGSILSAGAGGEAGDGMISFNHYAYGAVVDWLYRYVAGIAPTRERPGYRRMLIAPRPSTTVSWARATIDTRLGEAGVDWRLSPDALHVDVVVPPGAEAVLDLPVTPSSVVDVDGAPHDGTALGPGSHLITVTAPRVADPGATP